jgi:hypothetical protein
VEDKEEQATAEADPSHPQRASALAGDPGCGMTTRKATATAKALTQRTQRKNAKGAEENKQQQRS